MTKPLFMWAGGKTKHIKHLTPHFPKKINQYIEPFFGAGAVFLWIREHHPSARCVINDINPDIIQIYRSIQSNAEEFISIMDERQAKYIPLSKQERKAFFYTLRQEYAYDFAKWTKIEEAAALYFLMKTAFNGIWQINKNTNNRFGTPSGLLNQTTQVYERQNVRAWNLLLQGVEILSGDYEKLISNIKTNDLVYCDPPYRGSFTKYNIDFEDDEQRRLLDFCRAGRRTGASVILSNRDTGDGFWDREARDFTIKRFHTTYTAGRRRRTEKGFEAKKATEVILS